MKVYSESFNFLSLKIAFAAEASGNVVHFQNPDSIEFFGPKKFPFLEIEQGEYLFSTNSICRYLLAKAGKESTNIQCEEWVNWESSLLLPFVVNILQANHSGSKVSDDLKKSLKSTLTFLNSHLSTNTTLLSNGNTTPDLAEIVVWSTMFLLYSNEKLKKEFLSELNALSIWFEYISQLDSSKRAVNSILKGNDSQAFKEILLAISIPLPNCGELSSPVKVAAHPPVIDDTQVTEDEVTTEDIIAVIDSWSTGFLPADRLKPVLCPVLPIKGERNYLITSALPYVNNVPHLGNIIGSLMSADVFARYCRLRQYNTLYICGTDEYGTATETKALEEGITPQEICSKYYKLHKDIYDWFNIKFDHFGRTSTENQTKICQDIFWKLYNNGYILKDTTEQLHCNQCSRFLADRFVEGTCPFCAYPDARGDQCDKCQKLINPIELIEPRCKVCNNTPQVKSSEHLYLDLPKLQPLVKEWLDNTTNDANCNWSTTAKVISYAWLKEGLKPRCITRDLKWGTPVPLEGFTNKVFYVWFDAPIGYLSISNTYTGDWEKWWKNPDDVQLHQFMAKDNVAFHAIIFPASCIGANDNFTKVKQLSAVEYLNYEDTKFSKSRGIGVFGNDAQNTGIPSDIFRFYLLYIRPENQDTAFSWSDFITKNNSELLNNLGNYVNRASTFVYNNFNAKMPQIKLNEDDKILLVRIARELTSYVATIEKLKLRDGVKFFLNISKLGNQHIQSNKPWELVKGTEEEKARAGSVMALSVNIACLLSLLIEPYMPNTAEELRRQLNFPCEKKVLVPYIVQFLPTGHPINKPVPLFRKIEQAEMEELKRKYAGKQDSPTRDTNAPKPEKKAGVVLENKAGTDIGNCIPQKAADPAEIKAMEMLVAQQGEKVRDLKMQKLAKIAIDAEVAILLNLKKKLLELTGEPATKPSGKEKKKSKK